MHTRGVGELHPRGHVRDDVVIASGQQLDCTQRRRVREPAKETVAAHVRRDNQLDLVPALGLPLHVPGHHLDALQRPHELDPLSVRQGDHRHAATVTGMNEA